MCPSNGSHSPLIVNDCVCDAGVESELQINRLSSMSGVVTGGDEIVVLTSKIKKGLLLCCVRST